MQIFFGKKIEFQKQKNIKIILIKQKIISNKFLNTNRIIKQMKIITVFRKMSLISFYT